MLNKIKENILFLGLSIKREIAIFVLFNIVLIAVVVLLFIYRINMIVCIVSLCFIPFFDYLYISRYPGQVKLLNEDRNNELISLLSYFEIFISNHNNVYQSLSMLKQYASEWMEEQIDNLLKMIDNDKSVAPFVEFSNNFTYVAIQNVMISIYQMIDQGESRETLSHFDYLFASIHEARYSEKMMVREKGIETLNAFPLVGAGLITILLTISIMSILGDVINVI